MKKSIIEKERSTKDGKLIKLELEVPFVPSGKIVITPTNLVLIREDKDVQIVVHQHYCNIKKGLTKEHNQEDLHDIPWKSIGICLDPDEDKVLVGLQNKPWLVKLTHTDKEMELPP